MRSVRTRPLLAPQDKYERKHRGIPHPSHLGLCSCDTRRHTTTEATTHNHKRNNESNMERKQLIDMLHHYRVPVREHATDWLDAVLATVGDARVVLLGEATHGTHEFYDMRAAITERLIREKGFCGIAVEADWPDAYRVHRFINHRGDDTQAVESLDDFTRFPKWMWRNAETVELIGMLRELNGGRAPEQRVGFYGLDLYSMYRSIDAVVRYLETVDPAAAEEARKRYECFEQFGKQEQAYGLSALVQEDCRAEAIAQLDKLRKEGEQYVRHDGYVAEEELFYAEQNALLAANAEVYYRAMFSGAVSTWNLRDRHMADTLDNLMRYLATHFSTPKVVVWEHNSHIGDARATEVGRYGEFNVGQLVRERYGERAVNIGFTTHSGTVIAAQRWGGDAQRRTLRDAMENSYEELFHEVESPGFYLPLKGNPALAELARPQRLERAVGVIYVPATERTSHYFFADIARQFDGVIHVDRTRALEPLERGPQWIEEPAPGLYARGV